MPWNPSLPWPGSPGGASSPRWGGYIRLFVRAAIASGNTFHLGQSSTDRLDSGNVLAASPTAATTATSPRLWVDLSCDVISVDLEAGASGSSGIFTKADAATVKIELADPEGKYDPAAVVPPFSYAGRSRLTPGVPIEVYSEVVDAVSAAVTTHYLFTGTAESWREDWTTKPSSRRCVLVASDATKTWVRFDRPEQSQVGTGDTTAARIARLVAYFGWSGTVEGPSTSSAVLSSTTLAQSGWELLGRTLDDELGVVYFTPRGALRWTNRAAWFAEVPPVLGLGCPDLEPVDFVDQFDRPDGTVLGPEWAEARGDWGISNGQAALLAHNTNNLREVAYRPTESSDGVVSFAWGDVAAVNGQGVAFRIQDDLNFCCVNYVLGTGNMTITEFRNGAGVTAGTPFPVPNAAGTAFTVTLAGPTITVRNAAGTVLGSATSTWCQTARGVGLTAINALVLSARWAYLGFDYTGLPLHDVMTDATPSSADRQIRNVVRAARPGGTLQTATDTASVDSFGPYEYQRTDLGLNTDALVTTWAADVVRASAWPRIVLEDVTIVPGIDPVSWDLWPIVLGVRYVEDPIRVVWRPPDRPEAPATDQTTRVIGTSQSISRKAWTVKWQLASVTAPAPSSAAATHPSTLDLVDA
jgi:hypothetical protein